ncbi:hypothetical protein FACS189474_0450 [Bacteroidia bacterium]|nr:hypothetical protein FACS189474_0450 [Bacteroidia bacterium]
MKRIIILFFAVVTAFSVYSQTSLPDGDRCFDSGDYTCAITKYDEAFKLASGKDKQIAEIKLTRAKFCQEHIKLANTAFTNKQYSTAKTEYQTVLDSNPKDAYAQSQLEKCNNILNRPPLRKASTAELTDIWNNKYGIQPGRRQNLIDAGIDPDDAQRRINQGEGKPSTNTETTLSVSNDRVTAGEKEVKVYVNQAETTYTPAQKSNVSQKPVQQKTRKCFNCPQGDMSAWGLTFGYAQTDYIGETQSGLQIGIKYEPLFKYGFGLNFGLNYEYYNYNYDSFEIEENTLNLGAGLEYRFNFSKWFSPYIYGGVSFDYNLSANATYDSESYNLYDYTDYAERFSKYVDFGVGLRINHLQLNISKSVLWDYFENSNNSFIDNPGKVVFSVAYIF